MSWAAQREDKRRMKKTYEETKYGYGPGVWYDNDKERYIRLDFTNKWLKHYCRRVTRRRLKNADVSSHRAYEKRFYEYWWSLY